MSDFESGIFNSSLVFNYLLHKKNSFSIYLEDGSKVSGTLLGWDTDFLLVKEGKFLQMVRTKNILRLQVELDQIVSVDSVKMREEPASPPPLESTPADSTIRISPINNTLSKFKPTLTEVKTPPTGPKPTDPDETNEFKSKLDNLVRNW